MDWGLAWLLFVSGVALGFVAGLGIRRRRR